MCGSTPSFDRVWLGGHMPLFVKCFSHRHIDVSTLRELAELWAPEVNAGWKPGAPAHRALPDILESIERSKWFRNKGFVSSEILSDEAAGRNRSFYAGKR